MFPFNYNDVLNKVIEYYVDFLRNKPQIRKRIIIISAIILCISIATVIINSYTLNEDIISTILIIIIFTDLINIGLTIISFSDIQIDSKLKEILNIQSERDVILKRITDNKKDDKQSNAIDSILLNLNRITEYYTINLNQARSSYKCSITALVIGTLTILFCVWMFFSSTTPNITIASISGISGIFIEFIGSCYFYVYKKSIVQLNMYFKELVKIQDTMLAVELCEKLKNNETAYINNVNSIIQELLRRNSSSNIPNYES